jgi:hypothetical protein
MENIKKHQSLINRLSNATLSFSAFSLIWLMVLILFQFG